MVALVALTGCKNNEPKDAKIESIEFKQAKYEIAENDDINMKKELVVVPAELLDSEKITWTVDDESVAEMISNFLMPKGAGNVKVTATIQDKSASCYVSITEVPVNSITLKAMTLNVGETKKIEYTTEPSNVPIQRFALKSDKESVATIDADGIITAVKEGTANITATYGELSSLCKITVNRVAVTSVLLDKTTYKFTQTGNTLQLTATVKPDDASYPTVSWTSSNNSIATVNNSGLVTCKGYGDATITATADGKSATCKVTLDPIRVQSVSIAQDKYTIEKSKTVQLTATVSPSDATYPTITWQSSNTSVATVSTTGVVTGKSGGSVTITATADGKSATCTVAVIETGTVTDIDGNSYKTVKIGNQWWMAENLKCYNYDSQSEHPNRRISLFGGAVDMTNKSNWGDTEYSSALSATQISKLGLSYTVQAALGLTTTETDQSYTNRQGICPNGWHIPTSAEWRTLFKAIGAETNDYWGGEYYPAGHLLKSASGWYDSGNGTDEYGFSLLPAGKQTSSATSKPTYVGYVAGVVSSTYGSTYRKYDFIRVYDSDWSAKVESGDRYGYSGAERASKLSVRCVKN